MCIVVLAHGVFLDGFGSISCTFNTSMLLKASSVVSAGEDDNALDYYYLVSYDIIINMMCVCVCVCCVYYDVCLQKTAVVHYITGKLRPTIAVRVTSVENGKTCCCTSPNSVGRRTNVMYTAYTIFTLLNRHCSSCTSWSAAIADSIWRVI